MKTKPHSKLLHVVKQHLLPPVKDALRGTRDWWEGNLELLCGRRNAMTPPSRVIGRSRIGSDNAQQFQEIGEEFLKLFIQLAALQPHEKVLDVGCGYGRMALSLSQYLDPSGSYDGLDIVPESIEWCRKKITPRHPRFQFQLSDIQNKFYNPTGRYKAMDYVFPYADASFDFVFLASVFTHMFRDDMEHYLSEIARVLKPGGRCFITFFVLNDESLTLNRQLNDEQTWIRRGEEKPTYVMDFKHDLGGYYTVDCENPEKTIAYPETFVHDLHQRKGLKILEPIHYGCWCGRQDFTSFQDIVVSVKPLK